LASYAKEFHALYGISLKIHKGEAIGIVGLNGSGKSTLLQILAGILTPTKGTFHVQGRVAALLELGAGFNFEFTGRENAYMNAAILGIDRKELDKKFEEISDFAEIGEFMDQPVKTYSSGMVVRLAFSILTQIDPDILIIDEALGVGDAYFQHKCAHKIREFRSQGKTLIFVSHDPGAVKSLCDRAILLEKGKIIKEGKADAVLDYYNAIVAKKEKDQEIKQIETSTGHMITRSGNAKAEIAELSLINSSDEDIRCFNCGETARFRLKIKFNSTLVNPTVGLLIRDRLGVEVFGTNSFYRNDREFTVLEGSISLVEFEVALNLGPGSYSIAVAVHQGAAHTEESYDWFDNAVVFDVLPDPHNHSIGLAALPCKIKWE